jgi:hypothetical protein
MPVTPSRAPWRASSHSGANGDCVQVAPRSPSVIMVRDSKNPTGPVLAFTVSQWKEFTGALKNRAAS